MIALTNKERDLFAAYCDQESRSNAGMADQLEKISQPGDPMMKLLKINAAAYGVVAHELGQEREEMTIGGDG